MKKLKVAVYCRVANYNELTVLCQQNCLEHYASANGYEVLETISDMGSGASLERLGIRRLCDLVDTVAVDAIVATTPSRYARNTLALVGFVGKMKDKGVEVITVSNGSLTAILAGIV